MKWAIVDKETHEVYEVYEADAKDDSTKNRSWLRAEPKCIHLAVPEELDDRAIQYDFGGAVTEYWSKDGEDDVQVNPEDDTCTYHPAVEDHHRIIEDGVKKADVDASNQAAAAAEQARTDRFGRIQASRADMAAINSVPALRDVVSDIIDHLGLN